MILADDDELMLIIARQKTGELKCLVRRNLDPGENNGPLGYQDFAIGIADAVRHVAAAFKVNSDQVWEWIDKERSHPTSDISELKAH